MLSLDREGCPRIGPSTYMAIPGKQAHVSIRLIAKASSDDMSVSRPALRRLRLFLFA